MSQQAPFPALDPNDLGDLVTVEIDRLLIPYLIGVAQELIYANNYYGDPEDIQGTVYAMQELLTILGSAT